MKFIENEVGYIILGLLIIGQCTVGEWFFFGQGIYLLANIINVARDFLLKRPSSDKVKNSSLTAITVGLILIKIF